VARQVGGVLTGFMAIKSVIFSSSVIGASGLTFTVGGITWTTGAENDDNLSVATQIQSATTSSDQLQATQEIRIYVDHVIIDHVQWRQLSRDSTTFLGTRHASTTTEPR
jgi:hypothetical protein